MLIILLFSEIERNIVICQWRAEIQQINYFSAKAEGWGKWLICGTLKNHDILRWPGSVIVLSFDHRSFDQLKTLNHSLTARGMDLPFSRKSVVPKLRMSKWEYCSKFGSSHLRITWWLSANDKKGKIRRMITQVFGYFPLISTNRKYNGHHSHSWIVCILGFEFPSAESHGLKISFFRQ